MDENQIPLKNQGWSESGKRVSKRAEANFMYCNITPNIH
jgi:hypothetical protein